MSRPKLACPVRPTEAAVPLKAPFPYFGGKSRVAAEVWRRFGDVKNYVEPFCGSCAVLLGRPDPFGTETVNDANGFLANFWRAAKLDPQAVARYADWPTNENDLHARHTWLLGRDLKLVPKLEADPQFCDPQVAGYWVWGMCNWIGAGFCDGSGPWRVTRDDDGDKILAKLPHLGGSQGVSRQLPHLGWSRGVSRQLPHLRDQGQDPLYAWFDAIGRRLRRVRVCAGDWRRVLGPSVTTKHGLTAVFLDPPYAAEAGRDNDLYGQHESLTVAHAVREWALEHGDDPLMRIALCGYEGEHKMPKSWSVYAWKTAGGYASQSGRGNANAGRERIWFSPGCLP